MEHSACLGLSGMLEWSGKGFGYRLVMKKKDWILAGAVLGLAVIWLLIRTFFWNEKGERVQVTVDGEIYGEYSLNEDKTIKINETNVLRIRDGSAKMTEADCPDQICVHQRKISKDGETIICLPNKVVVTVCSGETSHLDGIAN